ncbi:MAG: diguanylate cyclase [Planctomycetota bacterium]
MKLSSVARITVTIAAISIAAILLASLAGFIPDERRNAIRHRIGHCQTIARHMSFLVERAEYAQIEQELQQFVNEFESCRSAALRREDGMTVAIVGNHEQSWQEAINAERDGCFTVPLQSMTGRWGQLEMQFDPIYEGSEKYLSASVLGLLTVLVPAICLVAWLHLSRILKYLDPSKAIPPRVRQTLDSFAEGVALLDGDEQIVLVNDAFADLFNTKPDQLIGLSMQSLPWKTYEEVSEELLPWQITAQTYQSVHGQTLRLEIERATSKIFTVNASPILDDNGKFQGVMVALADVTPLEQKREQLATTLQELHQSKDEITKQNEELRYLATRDPLTSCINRRTFFEHFDSLFNLSKSNGIPLCAMMVDIDFFKSINDNYGHSKGDDVLRATGHLLNEVGREDDVVCRYGGEEFSILMPGLTLEAAEEAAEEIRKRLKSIDFVDFTVTASLGLSEVSLGATDPQDLLDQADKCLYVAKRNGRDQVVRFDSVPEDIEVDESKISRTKPVVPDSTTKIPFSAVSALLSALSYRDAQTGAHSTRVASYAALLAQHLLGPKEVYLVEISALLHDIGKIGVPDAILLKPGRLSEVEWKVMERHDRIGIEIINKAFKHKELTDIVRHHHSRFDGTSDHGLQGAELPIGARILTIADSFDAMVSDRPYRKGMPVSQALDELRRCAGTQFDPELVQLFCSIIEEDNLSTVVSECNVAQEVLLSIGEQIESITDAADQGDQESFLALADRLRQTAEQSNLLDVAKVAEEAFELASNDTELSSLVQASFELLTVCRSLHCSVVNDAHQNLISEASTT